MKLRGWKNSLLALGLVWVFGACSSSQTKEGEKNEASAAVADAGTDAIPQDSIENPPPPLADGATPTPTPTPDLTPSPSPSVSPTPSETPPSEVSDLSTPPASSSAEPQGSSSPGGAVEAYAIQSGDTLMKIAFETYGDVYKWREIYEANRDKISNPNQLVIGAALKIEKPANSPSVEKNGERYLIKKGDTLGKIAAAVYGDPSKWRKIWKNNKQLIRNPNKIFAGFYLYYVPEQKP
jgi:nucleoid-associated protein YgaU